ncbi:MAG: hypothetical protein AB1724_02370 [Thermodesulfobacteriota bacterium]
MDGLSLSIKDDRDVFAPGETVEGKAAWQADSPPGKIFLRLFWFTRGKGTEDVGMVSEVVFDHPPATGARPFSLALPLSPYSFSGQLVSLTWALELSAEGSDQTAVKEIVVSPFGQEIDLTATVPEEAP